MSIKITLRLIKQEQKTADFYLRETSHTKKYQNSHWRKISNIDYVPSGFLYLCKTRDLVTHVLKNSNIRYNIISSEMILVQLKIMSEMV